MSDRESHGLKFQKADPIVVCTVRGSSMMDAAAVEEFGNKLTEFVAKNPGVYLLLNFDRVEYLSSAAISQLIRINDAIVSSKGLLRLCGLSKRIYEVFRMTNMHEYFKVNADESTEDAIARFRRTAKRAEEEKAWSKRMEKK
jgi:anti-sigma B factor antagonist